jgi:SNF family Na+-dependent transporter
VDQDVFFLVGGGVFVIFFFVIFFRPSLPILILPFLLGFLPPALVVRPPNTYAKPRTN